MLGTWKWNAWFGGFGALLTLLFSIAHNPLGTTLLRVVYAFAAFFAVAYAARLLLGQFLKPPGASPASLPDEGQGSMVDLATPDEEEDLTRLMKEQWAVGQSPPAADEFRPLTPKRVVALDNPDPQEVAQAIRRLTDE